MMIKDMVRCDRCKWWKYNHDAGEFFGICEIKMGGTVSELDRVETEPHFFCAAFEAKEESDIVVVNYSDRT